MTVLILGCVWPEPRSSAAGSRMMQLINCFKIMGCTIHFASAATRGIHAVALDDLDIQTYTIKINDSGFDAFAKAIAPQIVLFDRFMVEEQLGWRIRENCPDALCILDTEDLHGLRKARENALRSNHAFTNADLYNDTAKREIASIYRCDLSFIISEAEIDLLKKVFGVPERLLFYLPFMVNKISPIALENYKKFEQRSGFMCIGNFKHLPNLDAVRYLKNEIWSLIRAQLPGAQLHCYGAYPTQEVMNFHNEASGFLVHGYIENAVEVMQDARICLAPLRMGAGLKGKILESMQYGTPCVTTSVGAEGMYGDVLPNDAIVDDPQLFAQAAVRLYQDKQRWLTAQQQGREVVNSRFEKIKWESIFNEKINAALKDLKNNRLNNFTGAMLWHQSVQATKYMSRWIEEKNKSR